jgi:hypothetical protein
MQSNSWGHSPSVGHGKLNLLCAGGSSMRTAIAAAALLAMSAGTPLAQDVETGKASFRKCVFCHSIGENAKNKVGPELNGLDGRSAGAVPLHQPSKRLAPAPLGQQQVRHAIASHAEASPRKWRTQYAVMPISLPPGFHFWRGDEWDLKRVE